MNRGAKRWVVPASYAGIVLLLIGVVWLVVSWATDSVGQADSQASIFAYMLAAGSATVGLGFFLRRQGATPQTERIEEARATLARLVEAQWTEETKARSLNDPGPISVRWRVAGTQLMDLPAVINQGEPVDFAGRSDDMPGMVAWYRRLKPPRLVIVGPRGSGKTTLALQMLLELIRDGDGPVPVLFTVASWSPDVHGDLRDWLAEQLTSDYPELRRYPRQVVKALAGPSRLLPLLDGLDEVGSTVRPQVISAINRSLESDAGLILTSRRPEFVAAVDGGGDVLTAAVVIMPHSLKVDEQVVYLEKQLAGNRHRAAWRQVFDELRSDRALSLAYLMGRPLGLWLVSRTYLAGNRNPKSLVDDVAFPSAEALQEHLLDELIAVTVRTRRSRWDPAPLTRWLSAIAAELRAELPSDGVGEPGGSDERGRTHDWHWWMLPQRELPGRTAKAAFGLGWGLLTFGGPMALGFQAFLRLPHVGVLLATLIGLGLGARLHHPPTPRRLAFRLRGRRRTLWLGLGAGVLSGLTVGFAGGAAYGLNFGIVGGVTTGSAVALGGAAAGLVGGATPDTAGNTPLYSYRADRRASLVTIAIFGVVGGFCGSIGGAAGAELGNLPSGALVGMYRGVVIGTVAGVIVGHLAALFINPWPSFVAVTTLTALRRKLPAPWRLMRVLDDCYKMQFLRTVGPAFQFRHAVLEDHLARQFRPDMIDRWMAQRYAPLRRTLAFVAGALLIVSVGTGAYLWNDRREAEQARRAAAARQLADTRTCLVGTWDAVSTRDDASTTFGPAVVTLSSGGQRRWTFDAAGNASRGGDLVLAGTITSGPDAGRRYRRLSRGETTFTFKVIHYDYIKRFTLYAAIVENRRTLEEFIDGRYRGKVTEGRYGGLAVDVRCVGDSLEFSDDDGYSSVYRRH